MGAVPFGSDSFNIAGIVKAISANENAHSSFLSALIRPS
jgi:predicted benzoate:H+ symporter BenE